MPSTTNQPRGPSNHPHKAEESRKWTFGFQGDLVTPFRGLERDQNLRADSSIEKLSTLKPVFGKGDDVLVQLPGVTDAEQAQAADESLSEQENPA